MRGWFAVIKWGVKLALNDVSCFNVNCIFNFKL